MPIFILLTLTWNDGYELIAVFKRVIECIAGSVSISFKPAAKTLEARKILGRAVGFRDSSYN